MLILLSLYKDFIFLISIPFYTVEDISLMAKNRYDNFVHKINKIPSSQKMGDQGKKKKKKKKPNCQTTFDQRQGVAKWNLYIIPLHFAG